MTNILILHEKGLTPDSAWYPWLRKELEKRGCSVYLPALPENETFEEWNDRVKGYYSFLDHDSMIIGHGLGAKLTLKILQKKSRMINSVFLIAGSLDEDQFDFENVQSKSKNFFVYASDNDLEVPLKKTEQLASMLGESVLTIQDSDHFEKMTDFEDILIDIISVLSK